MFAQGTVIGGRYKLREELARGGMGSVWIARHEQLDIDVAVKFMDPSAIDSPVARARFEREARAAAQLKHANIVHVHDFGFEDEIPFLVMELLRGESLEERLSRVRRLPLPAVGALLVHIARGAPVSREKSRRHNEQDIRRGIPQGLPLRAWLAQRD